jgi:amidase
MLDATAGTDPADPATAAGEGLRPRTFRGVLKPDALKGARIGILKELFGTEREDEEAGRIVRKALDEMKVQGAEVVEVSVPDLVKMLEGTSVIDYEFQSDLKEYLDHAEKPAVRSLKEIFDRGLYHAALEPAFKRRLAAEGRDSEAYKKAIERRSTVREVILGVFSQQRLDALAYPTMKRKPARIEEPQLGSTCQLSATTGFPALSMPAGFTDDGLPLGIELLGSPFGDAKLVAIAFSFEQATHHRRAPFSTPALVAGRAPVAMKFEASVQEPSAGRRVGQVVRARLSYDPLRSELYFEIAATGFTAGELLGAGVHRGADGEQGAMIQLVLERGALTGSGVIQLTARDREALKLGALYLDVLTRSHPAEGLRAQLRLPQQQGPVK